MSNQSTPLRDKPNYNVTNRNKNQTTAMKRRRKRDPTICRRGVDNMNPYCVIRDEMIKDDLNKNNKYSKNVEKWCRYEYFYSSMDK
jgi:CDGSH-type Zn-finger protein